MTDNLTALAAELRALLVLLATDRHGNPWAYVESRAGSMVHVQPMIDRLDALAGEGWRPLSESLPELDQPVWLGNADTGDVFIGGRCDIGDGEWGWCNAYGSFHYDKRDGWAAHDMEFDDDYPVTHWMPLPTHPTPPPTGDA